MSRVCKKIAGLFGLAFVVGITAVASGIPPVQQASAVSGDVNVYFKVVNNDEFSAQIVSPTEGSISYSDGGVTAKISYTDASSLSVYLTYPDGRQELVDTITPGDESGDFDLALPVYEYGDYTITVSGQDLNGSFVDGDAKAFSYRAITAEVSEDGDKVDVKYGSNVCMLGFQVYKATDTAREHPLLDPEYLISAAQSGEIPNLAEVAIPGFDQFGPDEYTVVVTAYDCLDNVLDSDDVAMLGVINPPITGSINILGITISQTDYLITGLVVFVLAAIFALFLLGRRKKTTKR
ncbi:MAG: hypothetical protein LBT19_02465 [Candidatus Nomurabacteria bacterium]|jgi:hypothetical protein|nr:hypothetical protein [Candidatus Nomurabacteria bacterium]